MHDILIVGGGYAGFYAAWTLEKRLRRGEARVTVVDPRGYMTYQPFLPEVAAGSVEARHTLVPLRSHLRRTRVMTGHVIRIDHARRTAHVRTPDSRDHALAYDTLVVTAGAVTRTFPVPGLATEAIGLKTVEEAVAVRDRVLTAFARAAELPPGRERAKELTVTVVGGGFTGVELVGELLALGKDLLRRYPEIGADEPAFHLVEARDRILPEVTDAPGRWVVRHLESRGGHVHLDTQLRSAAGGHVVLSTGEEFDTGLLVWAAGNGSHPVVANRTDLPVDERGLLRVRADLRVGTDDAPVPGAWAAGDNAAVPDLAAGDPPARTVPNAQHAVRQGRLLARNIVADLRGRAPRPYLHHSLGVVATLGHGHGIFQYRRIVVRGRLAWLMHRGYHVLAVPTWERKVRVALGWLAAGVFGRDLTPLPDIGRPRQAILAGGDPDLVLPPVPADAGPRSSADAGLRSPAGALAAR
ncbi:NAD(P)/FAD-dependent oxidoreductase [Xylanimonas protaetiae]|uniref:NAD(P)/FAD-dependent oxidoreductase n=1 Tax=Xylanimonas protaetiae TaxID=2509457 RepID=A0A4P6F6H4_9MICO|nr:NAD(P)/FAD-dependent oxidoreductase [Xylanimonas protaetiae]QAY71035.1 NAD(P)/FAD-dependent oxidoreductase [Xylanimonas protaetiae]